MLARLVSTTPGRNQTGKKFFTIIDDDHDYVEQGDDDHDYAKQGDDDDHHDHDYVEQGDCCDPRMFPNLRSPRQH